jgi:hypothetical protein
MGEPTRQDSVAKSPADPVAPTAGNDRFIPIEVTDSRRDSRSGVHSRLASLVSTHLRSNGLRQIDFCRESGFDQGLLSKILSSVVNTLNVETALKLAEGMRLPPSVVFDAIGKREIHETLTRLYSRPSQ